MARTAVLPEASLVGLLSAPEAGFQFVNDGDRRLSLDLVMSSVLKVLQNR
jgi:hypothetical protein